MRARTHHAHRPAFACPLNSNDRDIYLVFEYMETDLHAAIRANILQDIHKQCVHPRPRCCPAPLWMSAQSALALARSTPSASRSPSVAAVPIESSAPRRYILWQSLKALKFMHSAELLHRDMKPANLLLNSDCLMKVADFGLARSLSESRQMDTGVALTDYVATRWYRAPELLLGSSVYGYGVDMWAMGCILGEMLHGKPIFPGTSTINQVRSSRAQPSHSLPAFAPTASRGHGVAATASRPRPRPRTHGFAPVSTSPRRYVSVHADGAPQSSARKRGKLRSARSALRARRTPPPFALTPVVARVAVCAAGEDHATHRVPVPRRRAEVVAVCE
jgi:serine/threonine protein kinase